MSYNHYLQAI